MVHRPRNKLLKRGNPKALLIDSCQRTRDVRAIFLRDHGVEIETAEGLEEARFFLQSNHYDLVLIDVRRYLPGEALDFCRLAKDIDCDQRIAFLLGSPRYVSVNWPEEFTTADELSLYWHEAVTSVAAA